MAIGQEGQTIAGWLNSVLTGDPTLMGLVSGVNEDLDPDRAAGYPIVRFTCSAPQPDLDVWPSIPILARALYEVLVTDKSDSLITARVAYARVHQLIQGARNVAQATGTVISCVRQQPYPSITEQVAGVIYRSAGGLYQIQAT